MAIAAEALIGLKPRQQDVLFYVCKGMRNAEIGALMGLTERTIKMYVRQLFEILEVTNRTELAGLYGGDLANSCPKVHVPTNVSVTASYR